MRSCVYCNLRPAESDDHVVARAFYKAVPVNAVTVPACLACNSGMGDGGPRNMSMEEEYMRNVLCMNEVTQSHPVVQKLMEKVLHSYERRPAFLASMAKAACLVSVLNQEGYLEERAGLEIEWPRIYRVVRKITKGLYFFHFREPVPQGFDVAFIPTTSRDQFRDFQQRIFGESPQPVKMLGEGQVFGYSNAMDRHDRRHTAWLMLFYNSLGVLTLTLPRAEIDRRLRPEDRKKYYIPLANSSA